MGIIYPSQRAGETKAEACWDDQWRWKGFLSQTQVNRDRKVLAPLTARAAIDPWDTPAGWEKRERAERQNRWTFLQDSVHAQPLFVGQSCMDKGGGTEDKVGPAKNGIRVVKEFGIYYSPSSLFNEITNHFREGCRCQCDGEKCWRSCSVMLNPRERKGSEQRGDV